MLTADLADFHGRIGAWRPHGTRDWVLIYTLAGSGQFRFPGGQFDSSPGDWLAIRRGASHDYGVHPAKGTWKNIWVHFNPRPECLAWIDWPEIGPGHLQLHLTAPLRALVARSLSEMVRHSRSSWALSQELAINALEHALLIGHTANPRNSESNIHPGIRRVVEWLAEQPDATPSLSELARKAGYSRARFATLFHQQLGLTPRNYLEKQRLQRARQMLEFSGQTLEQIADQLGYSSPFYLSLRFKKEFGVSPRFHRQNLRSRA